MRPAASSQQPVPRTQQFRHPLPLAPIPGPPHRVRVALALDDSRHSLLSKARPLAQTSITTFAGGAGPDKWRDAYGHYEVREVDIKSALTRCALPGSPWSLNPYVGCSHACAYCYVPDVAHLERKRWGSYVIVKRNLPTVLSHELARKEQRPVFLSSATDPYQPAEGAHKVTQKCLDVLARVDWPLTVLTRNPLVLRDIDRFQAFSTFSVGMSVPTFDDAMRRAIEPGAPSIAGRLRALRELADAGLAPFVNIAPAYPLSGGVKPSDIAEALREARIGRAYYWPWRYLKNVLPELDKRLPPDEAELMRRAVTDPKYYDRMVRQMRAAFRAAGVPFEASARGPG